MPQTFTNPRTLLLLALHRNYMKTEQAPLPTWTVNVEAFFGLTEWVNAAQTPPPCIGWWRTRSTAAKLLVQPQRRWWDGVQFSLPVTPHETDDDPEEFGGIAAFMLTEELEWCGLQSPHPAGYEFELIQTPKTLKEPTS